MNAAILSMMSGPIMAAARYAITAAGAAVVAKGYTDGATASTVGAGILALLSAGLGMLTSTKTAAIAKVADLPGYAVQTPAGKISSSADLNK
jgi:hypothetical protein